MKRQQEGTPRPPSGEVAALLGEVKELKAAVGALVTDAASARQDAIDDARLQRLIEARDARRI